MENEFGTCVRNIEKELSSYTGSPYAVDHNFLRMFLLVIEKFNQIDKRLDITNNEIQEIIRRAQDDKRSMYMIDTTGIVKSVSNTGRISICNAYGTLSAPLSLLHLDAAIKAMKEGHLVNFKTYYDKDGNPVEEIIPVLTKEENTLEFMWNALVDLDPDCKLLYSDATSCYYIDLPHTSLKHGSHGRLGIVEHRKTKDDALVAIFNRVIEIPKGDDECVIYENKGITREVVWKDGHWSPVSETLEGHWVIKNSKWVYGTRIKFPKIIN